MNKNNEVSEQKLPPNLLKNFFEAIAETKPNTINEPIEVGSSDKAIDEIIKTQDEWTASITEPIKDEELAAKFFREISQYCDNSQEAFEVQAVNFAKAKKCVEIAKQYTASKLKDYEEVIEDHKRLVRELDVIINGENAAQQASLCDIVSQLNSHQKK